MNRRHAIFLGCAAAAAAQRLHAAPSIPEECEWIQGIWRSDVERSMANFTFQGRRPDEENLLRIRNIFGKITHEFQAGLFVLTYEDGHRGYRKKSRFRIDRFTSSSISIVLTDIDPRNEMTLYRGEGYYFVRSASNFEYFEKVA